MRLPVALLLLIWPLVAQAQTLDMDADTDRTGKIEGSPKEEALEPTQSVIILNNCDSDDLSRSPRPDNRDNVVNGHADWNDVEPLVIRRTTAKIDVPISLRLTIDDEDDINPRRNVRVFSQSGSQVLGPGSPARYRLTYEEIESLASNDLTFYAEGLQFATSVKLELYLGATEQDSLILEVAPFILTPHNLRARDNMICLAAYYETGPISGVYVEDFSEHCARARVAVRKIDSGDVWIEDEVSWGFTETPRVLMPVALHMYRLNYLARHVRKLLAPDVGYFKAFNYLAEEGSSLDFGGNLEVTPPTPEYPFGRVYYGSIKSQPDSANNYEQRQIHPKFQEFFRRQKVQPPIDLRSDWLYVGHVDEVVTFLPTQEGGSFIVLLASPKLGLEVLRRMGEDAYLHHYYQSEYNALTVGDLLDKKCLLRSFEDYNLDVDEFLFGPDHANPSPECIKGRLMAELKLREDDFREVPALFHNAEIDGFWEATALTPGMVNLSSMGRYCIVPKPFIPEFRRAFKAALIGTGQTPLWINDWEIYHSGFGEVHCGSNEIRVSFEKKWWD